MNKEKLLKQKLTRLRKVQNPSVVDLKRIRKLRQTKTEYWVELKKQRKPVPEEIKDREKKKDKKVKPEKAKKVKKEPELEVVDSVSDEELDDLYSYDEDDDIEDEEE